jgi:hypothetical protein
LALVFILASAPSALGCTASSTIGSTSPRATHTLQQHTHFVPPVLRVLALWLAIVRYDSGLDTSLPVPNALEVEGHVLSFSVVVRCGRTTPREPPRRVRRYRRPRRISHGPADAAVEREVLHPLAQSACLSTSARGRAVATFGVSFRLVWRPAQSATRQG